MMVEGKDDRQAQLAWHFTGETLRDGRPVPPIGEWLTHEGPIVWCETGLYASWRISDALSYAPGNLIHRVKVEEIKREDGDKFVCRRRRIITSIDGEELLRRFARAEALAVAHLWDMPTIVREYLETGEEAKRAAARDAARAAAWDAAWAAASNRLEAMVLAEMGIKP